MIKIKIENIHEGRDGCAKCKVKDSEVLLNVNLASIGDEGIRVYHDGRLEHYLLRKLWGPSIYLDEITINITGWFHIHYKLNINVKEEYTEIKIINNI